MRALIRMSLERGHCRRLDSKLVMFYFKRILSKKYGDV